MQEVRAEGEVVLQEGEGQRESRAGGRESWEGVGAQEGILVPRCLGWRGGGWAGDDALGVAAENIMRGRALEGEGENNDDT